MCICVNPWLILFSAATCPGLGHCEPGDQVRIAHLAGSPYLLGSGFTLADLNVASLLYDAKADLPDAQRTENELLSMLTLRRGPA